MINVEELIDVVIDTDLTSSSLDDEEDDFLRLYVGRIFMSLELFDFFGLVIGDSDILDEFKLGFCSSSCKTSICESRCLMENGDNIETRDASYIYIDIVAERFLFPTMLHDGQFMLQLFDELLFGLLFGFQDANSVNQITLR